MKEVKSTREVLIVSLENLEIDLNVHYKHRQSTMFSLQGVSHLHLQLSIAGVYVLKERILKDVPSLSKVAVASR